MSLHCNDDKSYLFVNGKEINKFKADNRSVNFPTQFCIGSISNKFDCTESEEVSFKGNDYDFSVSYDAFRKSDILDIPKYLIVKNNIK